MNAMRIAHKEYFAASLVPAFWMAAVLAWGDAMQNYFGLLSFGSIAVVAMPFALSVILSVIGAVILTRDIWARSVTVWTVVSLISAMSPFMLLAGALARS